MHDKIRNYIYSILSAAPDCSIKKEIQEEMIANLFEKYNDLINKGIQPEEAYKEVISGIGDVSELVEIIKDSVGEKSESSARFTYDKAEDAGVRVDVSDLGRKISEFTSKLTRELEPMIRNITKEAAASAKASKRSGSRHLFRESRYDYEVDAEGIRNLAVNFRSGDVTIGRSPDNMIRITELSNFELTPEQKVSIEKQGDTLKLTQGQTTSGNMFFSFGSNYTTLEVLLPLGKWHEFNISSTSGDKKFANGFILERLKLKSSSGDIECPDIIVNEYAQIESTSGDLKISGTMHDLYIKTRSGDLDLNGLNCANLTIEKTSGDCEASGNFADIDIKSVSGDCTFTNTKAASLHYERTSGDLIFDGEVSNVYSRSSSGDTEIKTRILPLKAEMTAVSGNIKLIMPENDGFNVRYRKTSGSFRSDFDIMVPLESRKGTAVYKIGGPEYVLESTSGDLKIFKIR